jgi:hypothetical protein
MWFNSGEHNFWFQQFHLSYESTPGNHILVLPVPLRMWSTLGNCTFNCDSSSCDVNQQLGNSTYGSTSSTWQGTPIAVLTVPLCNESIVANSTFWFLQFHLWFVSTGKEHWLYSKGPPAEPVTMQRNCIVPLLSGTGKIKSGTSRWPHVPTKELGVDLPWASIHFFLFIKA